MYYALGFTMTLCVFAAIMFWPRRPTPFSKAELDAITRRAMTPKLFSQLYGSTKNHG